LSPFRHQNQAVLGRFRGVVNDDNTIHVYAENRFELYTEGVGADAYGNARYAWIRPGIAFHVERGKDWTTDQAAYRGLLSVLRYLPVGSRATVFSASLPMVKQFTHGGVTSEPGLRHLLKTAKRLVSERDLSIRLVWIPREHNLADAILRLKLRSMKRLRY
jgi:hypothetical protein